MFSIINIQYTQCLVIYSTNKTWIHLKKTTKELIAILKNTGTQSKPELRKKDWMKVEKPLQDNRKKINGFSPISNVDKCYRHCISTSGCLDEPVNKRRDVMRTTCSA